MLEGIDGTGTRDNGWSGPKLSCNLDGIILIKYANLCLKVAVLATVLCLGLVAACCVLRVGFLRLGATVRFQRFVSDGSENTERKRSRDNDVSKNM